MSAQAEKTFVYPTSAEIERKLAEAGSAVARIRTLDPERDCYEIYRLHAAIEFPWDVARALEMALFRTYCVPSIGGLLAATQEFLQRPQLRYEDTGLLLTKVLSHGFRGEGLAAVRRINQIHARFTISADDMRYVLSTFVAVPLRWLDRYGWRPLLDHERQATHAYYRTLGIHMGIREIPVNWQDMLAFSDDYERKHFAYTPENASIGSATRELFVGWYPKPLAPLTRVAIHALLDEPVRQAFGFPAAPQRVQRGVEATLQLRARLLARLPRRRTLVTAAESLNLKQRTDAIPSDRLGPDGTALPGASEPRCCPVGQTRFSD
jgi:ER-bound oxygenase mpaB/B'/Rubber oxygenase, catalytic domain